MKREILIKKGDRKKKDTNKIIEGEKKRKKSHVTSKYLSSRNI